MSIPELFETLPYGPAPEAADVAAEWLEAHERKTGHFIGGSWVEGSTTFETVNPATGETIAQVAQGSREDVDRAVRAAREALAGWGALGCHERARHLYAIARQIQKHARLFSVLESIDNGKPIRETRDLDIPLVARHFYYHAGCAQHMERDMPSATPVGVCGQIIPWNFPLLMLSWKIAPALAMGNTVVLKPAEFTPLTAILFAEICQRAGLPPGVVNIVTGDGETGRALVEHEDVDKIAFTGSTEVGRLIRRTTAGTGKKLSLELGGKSPFVVFDDADLDGAVEGLVDAIWFNQGQVCCAGSRLLVQEGVAETLHRRLRQRMATLRVGDPLDKSVDIGAIVAPVQLERIRELVQCGCNEGAELFQPSTPLPERGCFYPPTLLSNVSPASTVAQVEIFGPVLVSMTFRTPSEAVELANNTTYGLAASIWTESLSVAHDIAARVKAGTVWINSTNLFDASSGFGGYRESGFGREGGMEGLREYVLEPLEEARKYTPVVAESNAGIDRTHKQYIGGKQARPDSGYSLTIAGEEFARGNRKDVRNAVEAARSAQPGWAGATAFNRAQVLYYLAENLEAQRERFLQIVSAEEFDHSLRTLFDFAGLADRHDGSVHQVPMRALVTTRNEPWGVVGVACPDHSPLQGLIAGIAPLMAAGNACVVLPSETCPLAAAELYRVLDASDVPGGVVNIVTGLRAETLKALVEHEGVDAFWHDLPDAAREIEEWSCSNLKPVWVMKPVSPRLVMDHATQVKNVWAPYGA